MALLSLEGYPDEQFNQEQEEIDGNFQAQSDLVLSHLCVSMQLTWKIHPGLGDKHHRHKNVNYYFNLPFFIGLIW